MNDSVGVSMAVDESIDTGRTVTAQPGMATTTLHRTSVVHSNILPITQSRRANPPFVFCRNDRGGADSDFGHSRLMTPVQQIL
jgi:hypothetical protein